MPRRQYVGNAAATTINGAITAGSTEIQITSATNWPTGSPGPFVVILDRGLAAEEKILVTSRTGTTLFVGTRGFDSTTAASHDSGSTIEHGLSAMDIDEVNDHVFDITNDDHTQYLNNARHDVEARHTFGAALGTAATPAEIGFGIGSAGSGANPAREDHIHPHNPPACRVTDASAQSISDNTETTVDFDTKTFDTDTMHDAAHNSRITFTTAGLYIVTAGGFLANNSDYQAAFARIRLNGTTDIATASDNGVSDGGGPRLNVTTGVYKFAATNYVELRVFHNNTGNTARDLSSHFLSAAWVGTGN